MALRLIGCAGHPAGSVARLGAVRSATVAVAAARGLASDAGHPLVSVETDDKGVATLTMQAPPVNSLSLEMLEAIRDGIDEVADGGARSLVLTSSLPVFSAGLDITEMHEPEVERLEAFWTALQQVFLDLYSLPVPTAAAINGPAPAGGCLLSSCCDYRVMTNAPKAVIGLNETALGIVAPWWFQSAFERVIGQRQAERALLEGKLFTADEALSVGLVDYLVDPAEVVPKATALVSGVTAIPSAYALTKAMQRDAITSKLRAGRAEDVGFFKAAILNDRVQAGLGKYMAALKAKAGAK